MHNANRKVASDALMHVTVGSPATVNSVLCCAWKAAQCFHLSQNSIFIEKARTFENATFTIATGRHESHETLIFWKLETSDAGGTRWSSSHHADLGQSARSLTLQLSDDFGFGIGASGVEDGLRWNKILCSGLEVMACASCPNKMRGLGCCACDVFLLPVMLAAYSSLTR